MAKSVDSDETAHYEPSHQETAHYEPSHQDLHCLQNEYLVCRAEMVNKNAVSYRKKGNGTILLYTNIFKSWNGKIATLKSQKRVRIKQ